MRRAIKPVAVTCLAAMLLQGCAWIREHQKTLLGVGIGAATGAALGYAVRGRRGAVAGGLVGALAGGLIGNYYERKERAAQETNQAYSYQPAQGTRIEVSSVVADPNSVAPGGTVNLRVTYALMAPNVQAEVPIVETRVVTFGGAKVAELTSPVNRVPGTYTTQVPIQLRADSPRGQYQLTIAVAGAGSQGQQTSSFVVN